MLDGWKDYPMIKWNSPLVVAMFALHSPVLAEHSVPSQMMPVIDEEAHKIGMRFTLLGTRNANRLYWEIDVNGKGEMGIPTTFSKNGLSFQFDEGVHTFDIGPDSYSALRKIFENVMSDDIYTSMLTKTNYECRLIAHDDLPAMKLTWLEERESRTFMLHPTACISAEERAIEQQFESAWTLIGERMLASGQPGVRENDS